MRFDEVNTKFNHALQVDGEGTKVTSKQKTTAMLILSEPLNPEPYTVEDFPEDDIPGTFDAVDEEAAQEEEVKEEVTEQIEVAASQST